MCYTIINKLFYLKVGEFEMALNFKQVEKELIDLVEENPNDERIYQLLHDIAFNYLYNVINPGSIYYDYDMIAWDLAADLFLRIKKGTKIKHYVSYISHTLKIYYLRNYENQNWSIIIDPASDINLDRVVQTCCVGNRNEDHTRIENVLTGIYLSQFESIITEVMNETKFDFVSKDRLNLELSVLLTLNKKKETYFRLDEHLKPYIRIVISKIKQKIMLDGICDRDNLPIVNSNVNNNEGVYIEDL